MKLPATLSGRAEADLTNQYRWYLLNANDEVAERFLAAFRLTVRELEAVPGLGRLRRFRSAELANLRSFPISRPYESFLIFYRFEADRVSAERVMHGSRDLERRLVEPPEDYPS
ncbi:MAG: type II toxin-antitoxin system RelE/ParE family toxin [Verrucomicrobiota bacterium]